MEQLRSLTSLVENLEPPDSRTAKSGKRLKVLVLLPHSIFWHEFESIRIYRYLDLVPFENFGKENMSRG